MANQIQIKRSATTAVPSSLNPGELAYSNAVGGSGVLFIGSTDGGTVVPIGGVRNPGVLTANQALVANSSSGINRVYAANVDLSFLGANGSQGTAGYILYSGGTGSNAYWGSAGGLTTNVASQYAWTNTQSFSNTITFDGQVDFANAISANGAVGAAGYVLISGGAGANAYWAAPGTLSINTASQFTWTNTQTFTNTITFNSAILANTVNATSITIGSVDVINATGIYTNGTVNASSLTVGTAVVINSTTSTFTSNVAFNDYVTTNFIPSSNNTYTLGNTTNRWEALYVSGSTIYLGSANLTSDSNSNISFANGININSISIGTYGGTGNGIVANTSFFGWGNSTANVSISWDSTGQDLLSIAGNSNNYVEAVVYNSNTQSSASADFSINDSLGPYSNNYIDIGINGTGWSNSQWTINGPSDAYVYTGNTNLSIGTGGNQGNLTFFTAGTLAANERMRITAGGNVGINNTAPTNMLSVNGTTYLGGALTVTGTSSLQNVNVSGNLVVSGTVVTVNTATLQVNDNVIEIGFNNGALSTDVIDAGIYTPSNTGGTLQYSGLARIASSSANAAPWYKIFSTTTNPNSGLTITSSTTGALQAYLYPNGLGGGFVANASNVQITANGTFGVNFVANSLTLTTPLAATSGGTGQNTYSTGDLLYASSSSALSKLSVPGSAANGQVLQIANNVPAYGTLDGGTF
jgi:hypothetical protein